MHTGIRTLPWLLALGGLIIPLVGSDFVVWQLTLVWLAVLALVWLMGPRWYRRGRSGSWPASYSYQCSSCSRSKAAGG